MKHWTEPNGIFLIQIPIEWQYINPAVEGGTEVSPYSFSPYEDPIGCFQISCYPLKELAPKIAKAHPNGVSILEWKQIRKDDSEFCMHLFFGELADQSFIGKYIYDAGLENDKRIISQLSIVDQVLNSIVIVPLNDRKLAANLDKYDRFTGALAASYDLLDASIESDSYIEIIAISANQIDAYLRLSLVLALQLKHLTNEIEVQYLFQADNEKGIMERDIFDDSLKFGVIDQNIFNKFTSLYKLRNKVIHRYIISNIKTRDLVGIAYGYVEAAEEARLILRDYEHKQAKEKFGIYGSKLHKSVSKNNMEAIKRLHATVNDKHLFSKFKRKIPNKAP